MAGQNGLNSTDIKKKFSASPRESFSMEMSATGLQVFFNDRLPTCLNMKTAVFLRLILYV